MKVSIIIPTFNNLKRLKMVIHSLLNQTVKKDEYEIIVVDNHSTDGTFEWIKSQDEIISIKENQFLNSPYSCRNRGIQASSYELIALLDSTCIPAADWVETGRIYFFKQNLMIVGGNVEFTFNNHKKSSSEIYDSIINIQMENAILHKNQAKTTNLWFKREVIELCGLFKEGVRSGEDIRWTISCTHKKINLEYNKKNIVYYPARGFKPLIKKQLRVAKGKGKIWRNQRNHVYFILKTLKSVFPNSPFRIFKLLKKRYSSNVSIIQFLGIYFVSNIISFISAYGYIRGFIEKTDLNE